MNHDAKPAAELPPCVVGLVGFNGVAALDLTGPLEALASAGHAAKQGGSARSYRPVILGLTSKTFVSESGLFFKADATVATAGLLDTIIIPGGRGLRQPETSKLVAAWLAGQAGTARRIASVSTGLYALAESGLLDGRHVTTHWRFARDLARRYPKVHLNYTASFLKDDRFYTSAGGASGIEMTLALIAEDCGTQVAWSVARELVMRLRPPGDNEESYDSFQYQSDPTERVADLPAWISSHLHERLTVDALASRTCLCPRHFSRLFKQVFNCTPADFVEEVRLTEARRRLLGHRTTVENVAESIGFKSPDAFRRAFERRVGVTPSAFRRHAGSIPPKVVRRPQRSTRPAHTYVKHARAA